VEILLLCNVTFPTHNSVGQFILPYYEFCTYINRAFEKFEYFLILTYLTKRLTNFDEMTAGEIEDYQKKANEKYSCN
jgi:hypothetical protein